MGEHWACLSLGRVVKLSGAHGAVAVELVGGECLGLGLVLPGACIILFGREAAWRLGTQKLWGQSWASLGPCLVVGAQGKTLEAWVVKLLGGLSASARAQRTLDSLSLWRVYTLQRGSRFVGDGDCSSVVIVKLLGGQVHLRVGLEHSELTPVAQDSVTFEENLKGTVQTETGSIGDFVPFVASRLRLLPVVDVRFESP